jgi:ABC-type nitrate/sulfonate/bicarbonate transport system substrate-binding protein
MKYRQSNAFRVPAALAAAAIVAVLAGCGNSGEASTSATEIPQTTVNFGNSAFVDHANAIIGVEKGWFKDVGITLAPGKGGSFSDPSNDAAVLQAGSVDVQSSNYQILLPAYAHTTSLKMFAYGDFFIGFALMGKSEFKSAEDFEKQGMSKEDALRHALAQLKNRTLTWSSDQAVRGFGRTIYDQADMTMGGVKQQNLPDAQGLQLMLSGRADFQIGGAPTRQVLEQTKGFKPIVTAQFLTGMAKPPYETSEALAAVSTNGWATTASYWKDHHDTVMRLASVAWRISQYIHDHPAEAAKIEAPFLNSNSGTALKVKDVETIYRTIDPFIPFEEQGPLWFTKGKPTYEYNMIAASLTQAEQGGVLSKGQVTPQDISIAPQVYAEAVKLKARADTLLKEAKSTGVSGGLIDKAKAQYASFNFLDAVRFAQAALKG